MSDFLGGPGNDIFNGDQTDDTADGQGGDDHLVGNQGNDHLIGGAGSDTLDGGDGDDVLVSGDRPPGFFYPYEPGGFSPTPAAGLDNGTNHDVLIGGAGNDVIWAGYGDDADGGDNDVFGDKLVISFLGAPSGVTADFTQHSLTIGGGTIRNFESVDYIVGSNFDDTIKGGDSGSGYGNMGPIYGMGGNDHLISSYYTD